MKTLGLLLTIAIAVYPCLLPVGATAQCLERIDFDVTTIIGSSTGTWTATGLINSGGSIATHPFKAGGVHNDAQFVLHDPIELSDANGSFILQFDGKFEAAEGRFRFNLASIEANNG